MTLKQRALKQKDIALRNAKESHDSDEGPAEFV